jgi:bacterioferritin-associated ferredoxin
VIVCHCNVVNDRTVTEAVDAGARTLAGVCAATGAGRDCGSCVFAVKRLLCDHDRAPVPNRGAVPVPVVEVQVAAS